MIYLAEQEGCKREFLEGDEKTLRYIEDNFLLLKELLEVRNRN
jgi:hypothetical protein